MKSAFAFLLLLASVILSCAVPVQQKMAWENDPKLTAGYYEGDMIIDLSRNGLLAQNFRWPNARVYFRFSNEFNQNQRNVVLQGMQAIHAVSCVRFYEAPAGATDYISITGQNNGCYSHIGRVGGAQQLNLQLNGCLYSNTIVHELLHALGFLHMHSTSNRDQYVRIQRQNIQAGRESNFNKFPPSFVSNFGEDYDYWSILHYRAWDFSSNGQMTIVPLRNIDPAILGNASKMSQRDINKLNKMYNCV